MILRRLTQHIKDQNWLAVVLDFAIVVLGVFIGLQVGNWNDSVQERNKEVVALNQLAQEFTVVLEQATQAKAESEISLQATVSVLKVIREAQEPADKDAFLESLGLAASFTSGPAQPITLIEILSKGAISEVSSPALRTALVSYHELSTDQSRLVDLLLERVSTPDDGFHDAIHVNPEFSLPQEPFLDRYEWNLIARTRQQFQVILYGKLTLDAGIDQQISQSQIVLQEIEKALK